DQGRHVPIIAKTIGTYSPLSDMQTRRSDKGRDTSAYRTMCSSPTSNRRDPVSDTQWLLA
ncbi:MAG: hypothetical protein ACK51Y_04140, partial [Burkholderiales bacterium]